jgi:hypothetical protein
LCRGIFGDITYANSEHESDVGQTIRQYRKQREARSTRDNETGLNLLAVD